MDLVRVIAPGGATIRGPVRLGLTSDQYRRRSAILGKANRKGVYDLPSGVVITMKCGEMFGLDADGRLNKALFEVCDPEAEAKALIAEAEAQAAREEQERLDAETAAAAAKAGEQT